MTKMKLAQTDGLEARSEGEAHAVGWRQRGGYEHQQQVADYGALKRQLAGRVGGHRRRDGGSEEQHAHEAKAVGGHRTKAEALPNATAIVPVQSRVPLQLPIIPVQEPEPEEEDCRGDANPDRLFTRGSTRLQPTVVGCKQRKQEAGDNAYERHLSGTPGRLVRADGCEEANDEGLCENQSRCS